MNKYLDSTINAYMKYFYDEDNKSNLVVYDVGSRDGRDGMELTNRIVPNIDYQDIVLIEPNPIQAEYIRKTYPDATVLELAASNVNGTHEYVQIISDNIDVIGTSSLDIHHLDTKQGEKNIIKVETRRLDDIIEDLGHEYIDIMKIDTEGYSYQVLDGLGEAIHKVKVFHIETETKLIEDIVPEGHKDNLEIFEFMRDKGFLCYALESEWGDWNQDQVWVNAEML